MLVLLLLSAAWTIALAFIQIYTLDLANAITNTTTFDNGNFWLIPQPDNPILVSSVTLLTLFGMGYIGLAAVMLHASCRGVERSRRLAKPGDTGEKGVEFRHKVSPLKRAKSTEMMAKVIAFRTGRIGQLLIEWCTRIAHQRGENREYMVGMMCYACS